jgi:hypothetical protein
VPDPLFRSKNDGFLRRHLVPQGWMKAVRDCDAAYGMEVELGKAEQTACLSRFPIAVFPERRPHACNDRLVVVRRECQQIVGAAHRVCGAH